MVNLKMEAMNVLETLPDNSSLEDILYQIYVQGEIAKGLEDIKQGRVITHEELLKEVETWK